MIDVIRAFVSVLRYSGRETPSDAAATFSVSSWIQNVRLTWIVYNVSKWPQETSTMLTCQRPTWLTELSWDTYVTWRHYNVFVTCLLVHRVMSTGTCYNYTGKQMSADVVMGTDESNKFKTTNVISQETWSFCCRRNRKLFTHSPEVSRWTLFVVQLYW